MVHPVDGAGTRETGQGMRPADRPDALRHDCDAGPGEAARPERAGTFRRRFLFIKPYAAASYDRASATLFLPLKALESDWSDVPATLHEWRHARIHSLARQGDIIAMALESQLTGPDYQPDAFNVDELPVNACDLLEARARNTPVEPWRLGILKSMAEILRKQLPIVLLTVDRWFPEERRADVPGVKLVLEQPDQTERWIGGHDPISSGVLNQLDGEMQFVIAYAEGKPVSERDRWIPSLDELRDARQLPILASVCAGW
jgi:hypothetical protein